MQYSLYFNLRKSTNYLIDSIHPSNVKNFTSFSGDNIPVQGEIFVNLKFSKQMPSTRFHNYIIKDIGLTPPLLLGDDLLKTFLSSVSFVEQCGTPIPLVHFKKPKLVKIDTFHEKLSLINIVSSKVSLGPYERRAVSFNLNPLVSEHFFSNFGLKFGIQV